MNDLYDALIEATSSTRKNRVYLSGPMLGASSVSINYWRDKFIAETNVEVSDPRRKDPDFYTPRGLADSDLEDISECTHLVAWIPTYEGSPKGVGTAMEIFYANRVVGIPTVLFQLLSPSDKFDLDSPITPWHRAHATVLVPSLSQVIQLFQKENPT